MGKKWIRYLIPAVLAVLAGCEKMPDPVGHDGAPGRAGGDGTQCEASFDFGIMSFDSPDTKAYAASVEDGLVDRIDLFIYDSNGYLFRHAVIGEYGGGALDLAHIGYKDVGLVGETRTYLILANLDPDSAQYIGYLDYVDVDRYPEGFIPWSAGNCRVNYPLMGATAKIKFGTDKSADISLMRYMAKFEIGTISAEFWGAPDLYRNVYVKHVVFANAWDIVRICQTDPRYFTGDPSDLFGPRGWSSGAFGHPEKNYYMANCYLGQDEWSTYNKTYADMHGTYNQGEYGAKGKLNRDYHFLYNDNYKQPKHTINLDAPASLVELSQQTWDVSAYLPQVAGKLCSDIDGYLGPLNVNKAFYTLPTKFNAWFSEPTYGDESQNNELRLVLAVKINGTLYFYSKMLTGLNPNMVYKIHNITLKGEPSEYANTWVRGGQVTKATPEDNWRIHGNVAEIDNLVL